MEKVDLTEGKILKVITILALPIVGSSFLQFTYNLIDMMWVGRLGSNAVASIGSSSLYISLGNAIDSFIITGVGIKVSHALGRKDNKEAEDYINAGIIMTTIMGLIFGMILVLCGKMFIGFLDINNYDVEIDSYRYLALNAPILFFSFFNFMYTRILGSFGNNKIAFRINLVGVILNMVLDPLFIYTFNLRVLGAALSTLVANIVMFAMFLISSGSILLFRRSNGINGDKMIEITKLGAPTALQRFLFNLIGIFMGKIVAVFGSDAIAAQKIGAQIESASFMVIGGFNSAIASFTGQNFGAKKFDRIHEGYKASLGIGIVYALLMAIAFLTLNRPIVKLFVTDENTVEIACSYLKVVAYSEIFSAMEMISNGMFTGIGKPNIPAVISIVFTALRIPMSLLFIKPFGIFGVWLSICLSSVLKGIVSILAYKVKATKLLKE